jgi:hypothetical protein
MSKRQNTFCRLTHRETVLVDTSDAFRCISWTITHSNAENLTANYAFVKQVTLNTRQFPTRLHAFKFNAFAVLILDRLICFAELQFNVLKHIVTVY